MSGCTGFIYLAHPIDLAPTQTGGRLRDNAVGKVERYINAQGWGTYDPELAFRVGNGQEPSREIQTVNNTALGRCKGMVAFLPPGVVTVGVPIEIDRAAQNEIPVLILGGENSWALARYQTYAHVRVAQPGEGVELLLKWLLMLAGDEPDAPRTEILPFRQLRAPNPEEYAAILPTRAYDGDAGYDLYASRTVRVETGMVDIPTNLAVEIPDWAWGLLVGRSSTLRTKKLQVHSAVVDSGYRGELFAAVSKLEPGGEPVVVEAGERVAQLVVMSNHSRLVRPVLVSELGSSARGVAGFGSSGR